VSSIEETVIDFASKVYGINAEDINLGTTIKSLSSSSIKVIGLSSMLEDEYDITIPLPVSSAAKTIGDFVKLVESKSS
jgi:acyl carrier protein